ncbi:MAG: 50S ribosomal protein L29 [Nitrososphaerales archaeon]
MKNLKTEELSKISDTDLTKRLNELRTELSRLRSSAARGTLKKELGEIKTVRRNIARILTMENARKLKASGTRPSAKTTPAPVEEQKDGGKE